MTATSITTSYAPDAWLGTRLARELLGINDPHSHLEHAHEGVDDPLLKLAQVTSTTITELDWYDEEAERLRKELLRRAEHSSRHLDGPYRDGESARAMADRLAATCATREATTSFLRRLLLAYQAATQTS
ncbi:hypothetical protein AB0H77_04760 [Streptomyces sp. NPDC050844]|uniref:hypothetical protein n=1 Tax=Streptomyces sp. NPDC050844 TaxID=3155790 RepID=UPI0033C5EEF3